MGKDSTLDVWKKEYLKNPITKKFFTIKRNEQGDLIEIYYIFKLCDHIKESIFTFEEIIEIMQQERLKKLKYIGPEKKQKNIPTF
tara:strand:- start:412 stop:666 length:255 start_codon:yes stop_codon:yes gene_type:complete